MKNNDFNIMKKIKKYIFAVVAALTVMTSCTDHFFDVVPDAYEPSTYYTSDKAVAKSTELLYNRPWFNFNRIGMIPIGSFRACDGWNPYWQGEMGYFTTTSGNSDVADSWSSLYAVIAECNKVIDNIERYATSEVSAEVKNAAIGECHLMRGWAYFYLVRGWGDAIIYASTDTAAAHPVVPLYNEKSVLEYVIRDFEAADSLLPEQEITEHHPTRYAAKAALAKALLAQSGWVEGSTTDHSRNEQTLRRVVDLCNEVIYNGPYSLMDNYDDLFQPANNDNSETILALRWADPTTGGWGNTNAFYSSLAPSFVSTDPRGNNANSVTTWGSISASPDMIDVYNEDPSDTIRRNSTFFIPGTYYGDIWKTYGGMQYPYNGHCAPYVKKGVLGLKNDVSPKTLSNQSTPLNTYIQRLADVYLIKAEAILGNNESTTNAEALSAFNEVHTRAGARRVRRISLLDIINERRKEFAMEGANWWDMVTWYRWKPQYMLNYFNNVQFRGAYISDGNDGNDLNYGTFVRNSDGTFSYVVDLPYGPWHSYNWNYNCGPDADGKDQYGFIKYWNDKAVIHSWSWPSDSVVTIAGRGTTVPYNYRKALNEGLGGQFTPVVLSETNIFLPYPAADQVQNHYLTDEEAQKPIDYDFSNWH